MKINCAHDALIEPHKLVPNAKNPNKHPKEQIERLAQIIDYQGQRHPVIVSKLSGFVVVGHGRLEAIKSLGWEKIAVNYQDFESEAQEYAFVVSDNAIAEWAELDLGAINSEMLDLGPDFDIDLLGLINFKIEPSEKTEDREIALTFDYKLEIECGTEDAQQMILMEMQDRGFKVRVLL
jgi:ParB-like chromosome segregation protein Spo0J